MVNARVYASKDQKEQMDTNHSLVSCKPQASIEVLGLEAFVLFTMPMGRILENITFVEAIIYGKL